MTPRTQADLDSLTAADVGRLEDADLAAAFARLVAGRELSYAFQGWHFSCDSFFSVGATYWFNVATVDAIAERDAG